MRYHWNDWRHNPDQQKKCNITENIRNSEAFPMHTVMLHFFSHRYMLPILTGTEGLNEDRNIIFITFPSYCVYLNKQYCLEEQNMYDSSIDAK